MTVDNLVGVCLMSSLHASLLEDRGQLQRSVDAWARGSAGWDRVLDNGAMAQAFSPGLANRLELNRASESSLQIIKPRRTQRRAEAIEALGDCINGNRRLLRKVEELYNRVQDLREQAKAYTEAGEKLIDRLTALVGPENIPINRDKYATDSQKLLETTEDLILASLGPNGVPMTFREVQVPLALALRSRSILSELFSLETAKDVGTGTWNVRRRQVEQDYREAGQLYAEAGKAEESRATFEKLAEVLAYHARDYYKSGMFRECEHAWLAFIDAIGHLTEQHGQNRSRDAAVASTRLAWLWATCPDDDVRDGEAAVRSATLSCNMTRWKDFQAIRSLAAAEAEQGRFASAAAYQERALGLATEERTASRRN